MKKIYLPLLSLVILSAPSMSCADDANNSGIFGSMLSGPYIGLAVTAVDADYDLEATEFFTGEETSVDVVRPDIYAGYDMVFDSGFYLGVDAGLQVRDSEATQIIFGVNTGNTIKQGMVYYTDLLPGFVFANQSSLLYLLVGAAYSNFTLKGPASPLPDSSTYSYSTYRAGLRLGLGYTLALTNNFNIGLRYIHSDFGDVTYNEQSNFAQFSPSDNQVALGISYKFD